MALIEIDGLPNLNFPWWIFPWRTVNVITRWTSGNGGSCGFPKDPHLRIAGGEAWSDASPTSWDGSPGYGTANGFGQQEINGLDGHCLGKLSFGHGGDR